MAKIYQTKQDLQRDEFSQLQTQGKLAQDALGISGIVATIAGATGLRLDHTRAKLPPQYEGGFANGLNKILPKVVGWGGLVAAAAAFVTMAFTHRAMKRIKQAEGVLGSEQIVVPADTDLTQYPALFEYDGHVARLQQGTADITSTATSKGRAL